MPTPETARGSNRALTRQAAQGFQRRQQTIQSRLAEVEQTTPDSPDYLRRVERMLTAVDELLDYESRIPSLPEEQERRRNGLVVGTLTGLWTVVMVVVSVIVLVADGRSNWWLLLTVAVLGVLSLRVAQNSRARPSITGAAQLARSSGPPGRWWALLSALQNFPSVYSR